MPSARLNRLRSSDATRLRPHSPNPIARPGDPRIPSVRSTHDAVRGTWYVERPAVRIVTERRSAPGAPNTGAHVRRITYFACRTASYPFVLALELRAQRIRWYARWPREQKRPEAVLIPSSALIRAHAAVSTRCPVSVIATVCSKCAEREPSTVTIVHLSGSVRVAGPPMFTIGSIASVRPGHQLQSALRLAVVRHLRLLVELDADAVAHEVAHHAESRRLHHLLHRRADVAEVIARHRRGDPRLRASAPSPRAAAASPRRPRRPRTVVAESVK